MNILLVKNENSVLEHIAKWLGENGYQISYIDVPETADEYFLSQFMQTVKSEGITRVFSVNFHPVVSLACGALGIKYTTWIVDAFADSSYDYNINNQWNEVYMADRNLYNIIGDDHKKYLPLGITSAGDVIAKTEPHKDILVWTDAVGDTVSITEKMENLKDSTKGYIDSMMEQVKGTMTEWKIYSRFADYIKKDVENCYPLAEDSLEPKSCKYDRLFFFDTLRESYEYPYLKFILVPWDIDITIDMAVPNLSDLKLENDKVNMILQSDVSESDYTKLQEYKIIVYFPPIENGNKIPEELWNIMRLGIPVIIPEWIDTEGVLVDKFKNKREMRNKLYDYLNDDSLRKEYAHRLCQSVNAGNKLGDRLDTIFSAERG